MTLVAEIREQPAVLERLLANTAAIERVAAAVRERDVEHVVIAARGTSDHAAIYAQYLFGAARALGGPRDAVRAVALRRGAAPGAGAGDGDQPVGGVARHRRCRRRRAAAGRADHSP